MKLAGGYGLLDAILRQCEDTNVVRLYRYRDIDILNIWKWELEDTAVGNKQDGRAGGGPWKRVYSGRR